MCKIYVMLLLHRQAPAHRSAACRVRLCTESMSVDVYLYTTTLVFPSYLWIFIRKSLSGYWRKITAALTDSVFSVSAACRFRLQKCPPTANAWLANVYLSSCLTQHLAPALAQGKKRTIAIMSLRPAWLPKKCKKICPFAESNRGSSHFVLYTSETLYP